MRFLHVEEVLFEKLVCRDNRYVLVQIDSWPSHPEAVGKQALVEAQYVHFVHAASRCEGTAD